ncbi:MAG: acyltransferase [Phycisphaerae bacterium]|nr:acyltransferase [Phycisphaerae bacterium]
MLIWKTVRKYLNVSVIPFIPINCFRIWLYRLVGFHIGRHVFIGMQCYLDDFQPAHLIIEDHVTISYRVTVACHGPRMKDRKLVLREGCYIGTNVTLLGGTEIGPYATVGACALVTRSVPALTTVIGVPAKPIPVCRTPWGADDDRLEELKKRFLEKPTPTETESD